MRHSGKTASLIGLLLLASAGAFWAGLSYQPSPTDPASIATPTSMHDKPAGTAVLSANGVAQATSVNIGTVPNSPSQAQFAQLTQQLAGLQQELAMLKKQMSTTHSIPVANSAANSAIDAEQPTEQDASMLAMQRQQEWVEAKQAVQMRTQRLDQAVYAGQVDEAKQSKLQQQVQEALIAANLTSQVTINAANCSNDLCKVELQGQPKNAGDLTLLLYQKRVFPSGTKVLTMPNANGHLTIYASMDGKALPH